MRDHHAKRGSNAIVPRHGQLCWSSSFAAPRGPRSPAFPQVSCRPFFSPLGHISGFRRLAKSSAAPLESWRRRAEMNHLIHCPIGRRCLRRSPVSLASTLRGVCVCVLLTREIAMRGPWGIHCPKVIQHLAVSVPKHTKHPRTGVRVGRKTSVDLRRDGHMRCLDLVQVS